MTLRLLQRLHDHAIARPQSIAVRSITNPDLSLTYRELTAAVEDFAEHLSSRFSGGDVVMLACPNVPAFHVVFLAALSAGLKIFPVPPDQVDVELLEAARRSRTIAVIGTEKIRTMLNGPLEFLPLPLGEGRGEGLEETRNAERGRQNENPQPITPTLSQRERGQKSAGLLLQSSGTTGRSKIVLRDAISLDAVASQMAAAVGFTPQDRILSAVPLCHSYGLEHGLLAPIFAGSAVHLADGFDLPLILRELEPDRGITIFPGVPFFFEAIATTIDVDRKFPHLRTAYSAGGPLPRTIFDRLNDHHGLRVAQLYGATEIGSVAFNDPWRSDFDPASVGCAMDGVEIRILGEGEVAVRAKSMFRGYLDTDEPPPLADGFFLTGDLGKFDATGALTITGRLKFLIDVGGRKVNPMEVEDVLQKHPAVAAAVVVPLRMSETIFRLKAIIQLRPGTNPSADDIRTFARQHLSAYKIPRVIEFRNELPRSKTGKIMRNQLTASNDG